MVMVVMVKYQLLLVLPEPLTLAGAAAGLTVEGRLLLLELAGLVVVELVVQTVLLTALMEQLIQAAVLVELAIRQDPAQQALAVQVLLF
jgi:hypothetical protein